MSDCECLNGCLFFNGKMRDTDGLGAMYKQKYCRGNNAECARYQISKKLGSTCVPADLYPNMNTRAKTIIIRSTNIDAIPTQDAVANAIHNLFTPVGTHK